MGGALDVLLLAPHWPPEACAAAARLESFTRHLQRLGHSVRVVAPTPGYQLPQGVAPPDATGVTRVAVPPRGPGALGNAVHQWRLRRALRREAVRAVETREPDVVMISSPPPVAALAGLGLRGASGRCVPAVLDVRDIWPDVLVEAGQLGSRSPAAAFLRHVERRLLAGVTALVTPTETKVERLRARAAGVPVTLVVNGVEDEWWREAPADPPAAGSDFVVLHAGNVGRAQDVGLLVRAVAQLRGRAGRRVRALVVGGGEELAAVQRLARELDAPVELRGPVPRLATAALLDEAGCAFVSLRSALLTDAVPSKLLDAMGRSVPVVLAAAGEAARIVEQSGGGIVVAPGDVAALAAALSQLADATPEARRAMRGAGFRWARPRFSRPAAGDCLADALAAAARGGA